MKNAKVTITSALLAIAAFSSMADAKCAFTEPQGGTTFAAGDTLQIQWIDDGSEPKCSDMTLGIELRVGSQDTQDVAATVTSDVPGSAGSASYVIPKVLQKTDSTYFLEMHKKDAPQEFQNFSGRFTITGVTAASGDSGSTNSTDTNPGDSSSSGNNTTSGNNSTDTTNSTDSSNNSHDNGSSSTGADKNSADGSSSTGQSSSNANGASGSTSPNTTNTSQQTNAASSSWSASFTSLAIVAVGAVLSNVF